MISFGELRKKSAAWQIEISTVEKIYARDWLLKGIFDRPLLHEKLTLRGASALATAYFAPGAPGAWSYPRPEDVDLLRNPALDDQTLARELEHALGDAARASGLQFRLNTFQPSEARIEFTGPLGRRSAAQPLIITRFVSRPPRSGPVERPLIHPFNDSCAANVRAVSLNELASERIILYGAKPRARDVFDLWFVLTQAENALDLQETRALIRSLAAEKHLSPRMQLDPQYAPLLERAWENALKEIRPHPSFPQAQKEIETTLSAFL